MKRAQPEAVEPLLGPSAAAPRRRAAPLLLGAALAAAALSRRAASLPPSRRATQRLAQQRLAARATDDQIERWLNASSGSVACASISYALCDISACTLTGDGYTAACGCLPMEASSSAEATLALGWASAILTFSDTYLDVLEAHAEGDDDDDALDAATCDALDGGGIWSSVDADRTSLFGSNELVSVPSLETETCSRSYGAGCQGAPCWDVAYDDHFSVTCLCPFVGPGSYEFEQIHPGSMCDEMEACAGVARDATTYDYDRVLATISSVDEDHRSLLDTANSTECPITCDYCSYSYSYD